jgi:exodeoxyribonuclease VII large subunit
MPEAISVQEVTQRIAQTLKQDYRLKDLWIEGEVSNFKRQPNSGHAYFTLKDAASQLGCVMWRTSVVKLLYVPNNGDHVRVHGYIDVYPASGVYQLYADALQPVGLGALYLQFEQLKARLQAEGLFDSAHKRPLPQYPLVIGVVTSPGAAAWQDIQNVLRRRYPLAKVLLSPTQVQGEAAPPQIVQAIEALNDDGRAEVILLARGGGSIEDLWAFNDERVARAVFDSAIPIVTGVGHEIDFTIVDFVSDLRAPTPSAGAELITPEIDSLRDQIDSLHHALRGAMFDHLDTLRDQVAEHERTLRLLSPRNALTNNRQRIDDLNNRITGALHHQIERRRERLAAQGRALDAANPANLLERGYAIVTRTGDGKRLSRAIDAGPGTGITVQLADGELRTVVKERTLNESKEATETTHESRESSK